MANETIGEGVRAQKAFISPMRSQGAVEASPAPAWQAGHPAKPWSQEWFIAETTYGSRVVLRALPADWTYDFTTADDTYIRADKIKRWMQFPDSEYIFPSQVADLSRRSAAASDLLGALKLMVETFVRPRRSEFLEGDAGEISWRMALAAREAAENVIVRAEGRGP